MTFREFDAYQMDLLEKVIEVRDTKGKEYANSESRFANFDAVGADLGITNIQVGYIFLTKHIRSIAQFCRTGVTYSDEPIQKRILDAIGYLTLIGGMIAEIQEGVQAPKNEAHAQRGNADQG